MHARMTRCNINYESVSEKDNVIGKVRFISVSSRLGCPRASKSWRNWKYVL